MLANKRHLGKVFTLSPDGRMLASQDEGETSDELTTNNHREADPTCEGDHEMRGHVVNDHATKHHVAHQYHRGKAEREVFGEGLSQERREKTNGKLQHSGSSSDGEPTCEGSHAMQDHVAEDHAIEHHEIHPYHRGETDRATIEEVCTTSQRETFPWLAPRVMQQYLEQRTNTAEPTTWSIDDYDGEVSWEEIKQQPSIDYRHDSEVSRNQYHKLMHALYQFEGETDELIKRQETRGCVEGDKRKWQKVRDNIKEECMSMYREIEGKCEDEDLEVEKERKQKEFKQANPKDALMMFEKGDGKKKKRRVVEEDSSDDEDDCQLVCNMTGMKWESFPFLIIVDSGACASVMPQS